MSDSIEILALTWEFLDAALSIPETFREAPPQLANGDISYLDEQWKMVRDDNITEVRYFVRASQYDEYRLLRKDGTIKSIRFAIENRENEDE